MTETVYFRADTFRADIYLPRLHELTITNIRKLLRLVFCYDWENEEAIQTTGLYIQNAAEDSLQAWKEKSQEYAHGWRNLKGPFCTPADQRGKAQGHPGKQPPDSGGERGQTDP